MNKTYIITGIVLVCLIGLMIINQTNDGDLNDYEIYEPTAEVNELEEDVNAQKKIEDVVGDFMIIAVIIGIIGGVLIPIISLGRRELNY